MHRNVDEIGCAVTDVCEEPEDADREERSEGESGAEVGPGGG